MEPSLDDNYEDTPCYEITIKVCVSGDTDEQAFEYIKEILNKAKRDGVCEIYEVEYQDHEEC